MQIKKIVDGQTLNFLEKILPMPGIEQQFFDHPVHSPPLY
jgi:hypothetical protein